MHWNRNNGIAPSPARHSRSLLVIGQITCNQAIKLRGIEPSLSKRLSHAAVS